MSTMINGHQRLWDENDGKVTDRIVPAQVDITASLRARAWLVDGGVDKRCDNSFLMILDAGTQEDAARAYARHRKEGGHVPPSTFRVFPLASLRPITLNGVIDPDGDEEWSAFSDAWVEIRL